MITGTILNVKRFEIHDGDGIRTTLFLKGCPLRCQWCHNPESLNTAPILAYYQHKCISCGSCTAVCETGAHRMEKSGHIFDRQKCTACGKCQKTCLGEALMLYGKQVTPEEILPKLLEDANFYRYSGGGVTISGGEPLMQAEFTAALLALLQREGINTAVDTSLFVSRNDLDKVIPFTNTFLVDIKAIDPQLHQELTGQDNAVILDHIQYLSKKGCRIEIRIPYIPTKNIGELPKIAAFLTELPAPVSGVKVLPYHDLSAGKYEALALPYVLSGLPVPTKEQCEKAEALLRCAGLSVIEA